MEPFGWVNSHRPTELGRVTTDTIAVFVQEKHDVDYIWLFTAMH
jgi:hypothetical protein